MMKKLISLVLCVLFLGSLTFAQAETEQEAGSAVDIVLLIDQSGSVWAGDSPTDPDGYRLDAAQMVIALLGRNGSRVAYVPFGGRVFENADSEFHTITSVEDYEKKMKEVESLRERPSGPNGENGGGTDFAEPLAYAYNLLAKRTDDRNQPMIILLTDGIQQFSKDSSGIERANKPYYVWNNESGLFEFKKDDNGKIVNVMVYANWNNTPGYTYYASDLLDTAVEKCQKKEYPVYTIALNADNKSEHYKTLDTISKKTGADEAISIGKGDTATMQKLPAFFGDMFAKRIGSSELRVLTATCIDPEKNTYEVKFVIPNKSVMEANIFVSKENISGYYLLDAEGKRPNTGTVTELESDKFVLYKLNNPSPYGIWRLRFTKSNNDTNDISFNLVYNYDVVLHGYVEEKNEKLQHEEGGVFKRGDTLVFSGKFYDNREQRLSADPSLYKYSGVANDPTDDWCEMNASYILYQKMGGTRQPILSGKMDVEDTRFYKELDMKEIRQNSQGNNTMVAGEYDMDIHVEGCGLARQVSVPFTLENTPPSDRVKNISLSREVDGDDAVTHEMTAMNHRIDGMLYDYDNDEITVTFKQTSGLSVMKLAYDPRTQSIVSTPVKNAKGNLAYGTASGLLTVRETNDAGSKGTSIPVTMTVTSGLDELSGKWDMRVKVNNSESGGGVQGKDQDVEIELALLHAKGDRMGTVDTSDDVKRVSAKVEIVDNASQEVITGEMVMKENGLFTYNFRTGLNAGQWNVKVTTFQAETGFPIKYAETFFTVENNLPSVKLSGEIPPRKYVIYHNPMPGFLSILGEPTEEKDRTIDLNNYFVEKDHENLKYAVGQEPHGKILSIDKKDNIWVLNPVKGANSKTSFTVVAQDNDNAQAGPVVIEVDVIDLTQVWVQRIIIAAIGLVIFVITCLIIHQIRKPKFPKGHLGVREGNSDYDTNIYEFLPSKKPISLAAVVMTDTAAKYGISANALTNIELVPVRTVNGSIGVRLKKKFNKKLNDVNVALPNQNVSTKTAMWAPGDALILSGGNNSTGTELSVILFPADPTPINIGGNPPIDGTNPFDGDVGGFNSDVDVFGVNNDENDSFGSFVSNDDFSSSMNSGNDDGFGSSVTDGSNGENDFTADNDSNDDNTLGF